jgi:thiol:disulfide interchange protein
MDRSAAALSGLCVLHCALGAALLAVAAPLPWLGAHGVHAVGLALVLPIALFALLRGRQRHGDDGPLVTGVGGLALMALGVAVGHGSLSEFLLVGAGAAVHATAHGWNLRRLARVRARG